MRRRLNTRQRNYIILGLCSILLVMATGYAAFRSQLTINGTSNISSEWEVLITGIKSSVLSGQAEDAEGSPSYTETTANFSTELYSPGDSMQYNITVKNSGSIDAVLKSINVSTPDNEAIIFETSGIKKGDKLAPKESDVLTVTVTYNSDITSQPSKVDAEVEVTLNYVQDDGTILPDPVDITENVVDSGDGLYKDEYEEGRYVYKGRNPDNYIMFNNELWRIISVESDGTLKIMRNASIENRTWDSSNSNDWTKPSDLNTYLNEEYIKTLSDSDKIVPHNFSVGAVSYNNNDLAHQIFDENSTIWKGNIGLITVSEYLRANTNAEQCGTFILNNNNYSTCKTTNWMYSVVPSSILYVWSISPYAGDSHYVFHVNGTSTDAGYFHYYDADSIAGVVPVLYLSSNIILSGYGTHDNPYIIN